MTSSTTSENNILEAQRQLQLGNLDSAKGIVHAVLDADPLNMDAVYTSAVISRLDGAFDASLISLKTVIDAQPENGRAYQEQALNLLSKNDPLAAGRALERAVSIDPSLVQSWKLLVVLYQKSGSDKHLDAQRQVEFLESLPDELLTVIGYLAGDRMVEAERLCRYFLKSNKTHIEGMRLLAEIANRNNILDDAEFLLETAVQLEPSHVDANIQFAHILLRRQRFQQAYDQAKKIYNDFPEARDRTKPVLASASFGVGKNDEAIKYFKELIDSDSSSHLLPISIGHIYNAEGDSEEAIAAFKRSFAIKKDHGDAYWSLANTKSYRFNESEIAAMQSVESDSSIGLTDRIQICFALGKAFEDQKDFAKSFQYYQRGNALKLPETHHSKEQLQKRIDSQIEICDEDLFESRKGTGSSSPDPIFVVGLPRAGLTLISNT